MLKAYICLTNFVECSSKAVEIFKHEAEDFDEDFEMA